MHVWYKVSKNHSLHSNDRTPRNDQAHGSCASTPIPNPIQNHPRSRNDTLCPWRSSAPTGDDTARSPSPWWTKKEQNAEGPKFLPSSPKDPPLPEVEGGRRPEEQRRRWYRIAGERNVVTFKLEWTTVCVEKEKERERGEGERGVASGRCRPRCVCVCAVRWHTRRTAEDRIQNSGRLPSPRAVMRSCPSTTTGSHRVSSRNFNTLVYLTNPLPFSANQVFLILEAFPFLPSLSLSFSFLFYFFLVFFFHSRAVTARSFSGRRASFEARPKERTRRTRSIRSDTRPDRLFRISPWRGWRGQGRARRDEGNLSPVKRALAHGHHFQPFAGWFGGGRGSGRSLARRRIDEPFRDRKRSDGGRSRGE